MVERLAAISSAESQGFADNGMNRRWDFLPSRRAIKGKSPEPGHELFAPPKVDSATRHGRGVPPLPLQ